MKNVPFELSQTGRFLCLKALKGRCMLATGKTR